MQRSQHCRIEAIASRDLATAKSTADALGIPKAYGSYAELFADPEIEAVYNPLPNHLHVPLSIEAAEAGKHVLCEKPIALDAAEVAGLIETRDRTGVVIQSGGRHNLLNRHRCAWNGVESRRREFGLWR